MRKITKLTTVKRMSQRMLTMTEPLHQEIVIHAAMLASNSPDDVCMRRLRIDQIKRLIVTVENKIVAEEYGE